jgi:hypothetical protein
MRAVVNVTQAILNRNLRDILSEEAHQQMKNKGIMCPSSVILNHQDLRFKT